MRLDLNSHVIRLGHFACAAFAASLIAAIIMARPEPVIAQNLLRNGDFSEGGGNQPSYWYADDWIDLPTTTFKWIPPSGGEPGMAVIENQTNNAANWSQSVRLDPGWYYVGAEIKASCEGESRVLYGAFVTLKDLGAATDPLKPSEDWQDAAFYLEVGSGGAQVQVRLRLVCFRDYPKGRAWFRSASVVKVNSPPHDARQFHLSGSRNHFGGKRWSLLLLAASLAIGALAGWAILPASI